eukprot:1490336-Prymnesium_polylepis.1
MQALHEWTERGLFTDTSAEFNKLVDLYAKKLTLYMSEALEVDADLLSIASFDHGERQLVSELKAMEADRAESEQRRHQAHLHSLQSAGEGNANTNLTRRYKDWLKQGAMGTTAYRLLVDEVQEQKQDTMQHQMARLAEVPE